MEIIHSEYDEAEYDPDFADLAGQENAKRAVVIAAAGRHGLLMVGSPGCGKTMIAGRMAGVMPAMTDRELLETAIVRSVAGRGSDSIRLRYKRPFRTPHHTIGRAGLVGGGSTPVPGEITLAHNGVLFLDEVCEFNKDVIESLRIPLEDKKITHFRKGEAYTFPCNFQIVLAANPCPCGFYGEGDRCTCSPSRRIAYISRLSGPIMDRIDIQLVVSRVEARRLISRKPAESSACVAARVLAAREIQKARLAGEGIFCNAAMNNRQIEKYCPLSPECREVLERIIDRMGLSARACSRIIKLARTIADLAGIPDILPVHLSEAASYRFLDKQNVFEV